MFESTEYKIFERFINDPQKRYSIRELARECKLTHPTVIKYIRELEGAKFIRKDDSTLYDTYLANTESEQFRLYQKFHTIRMLMQSGMLDVIKEKCFPHSIVLFGSASKGTLRRGSDIDIFVESMQKSVDISGFEKAIGREINLLFEEDIRRLSDPLRQNIVNGYILYGFVRA